MLDDLILFPITETHLTGIKGIDDGFETLEMGANFDEMDAPEIINEDESDVDWAIEYDESLSDDSDDFHGEEE